MEFNKNNNIYYGIQKLHEYLNDKRRYPKLKRHRWFKYKFKRCVYKVEAHLKGESFDETVHRLSNRPREMTEESTLTKYMVKREEYLYKRKNIIKYILGNMVGVFALIIAIIALFKP